MEEKLKIGLNKKEVCQKIQSLQLQMEIPKNQNKETLCAWEIRVLIYIKRIWIFKSAL